MRPALRLVSDNYSSGPSDSSGRAPKPGNGAERIPTILMVEDEILIRLTSASYLRLRGYRVLEASNAAEALSIFAAGEPIELVFSDINMPGSMNGGDLAQWIRQHFPDVKVILTSGESTAAKEAPMLAAYGPFIKKPYSHDTLLAEIKRLFMA